VAAYASEEERAVEMEADGNDDPVTAGATRVAEEGSVPAGAAGAEMPVAEASAIAIAEWDDSDVLAEGVAEWVDCDPLAEGVTVSAAAPGDPNRLPTPASSRSLGVLGPSVS
jgi:hypothetical protein